MYKQACKFALPAYNTDPVARSMSTTLLLTGAGVGGGPEWVERRAVGSRGAVRIAAGNATTVSAVVQELGREGRSPLPALLAIRRSPGPED